MGETFKDFDFMEFGVLLLDPAHVPAIWPDVVDKLDAAMHASKDEYSSEWVYEDLMNPRSTARLWISVLDDEIKCVAVTECIKSPNGIWLNIPFVWSGKDLKCYNRTFDHIEQWARDNNFYGIKFVNDRPESAFFAKRKGFTKRFVEYIKPFERVEDLPCQDR